MLDKKGTVIKDFLEKETGFDIKMMVPTSYDELVDNFNSPTEFCHDEQPELCIGKSKVWRGCKVKNHSFWYSSLLRNEITRASSGIKDLDDLNGKSFAYVDELSTSGYMYPKKDIGKKQNKAGERTFTKKHDGVV